MLRKINADELKIVLDWINYEYCVDHESMEELLDTDEDELSVVMYKCGLAINRILHYDSHDIYVEDL